MLAPIRPDSVWALGTLAAVGLLATLAWLIGGILTERRRVLAALFLGIAVLAVPFSGSLLAVTLLYALLGSLSLAALVPARRGRMSLGVFRPVALTFFVLTETFGYLASWQSSTIWWIGSLAAITALLGARLLVDRTGDVARGLLLAGAIALTLVAAIAAPWMLTLGGAPSVTAVFVDCLRALTLTTALLQLFVALPLPRLFTVADRRWAFWTLLAPTVLAFALPVTVLAESLSAAERAALLQGAPAAGIAHATVLLAALLFWLLLPANRDILARERLVAAIGVAPVLWLLLWSVARIPPATPEDRVLVVPAAALVACGLGLTLGLLRGRSRDRLALEAGAALVLVPGTIWALATAQPLGWLMLLLAGIAALLSAIAADGLFGSRSHRRHLGWLALALGTSGLWLGLARAGTTDVEPYVLPVAGVLLLLAALLHRFGRIDRIDRATTAGSGAALLALAAGSGSLLRAVLVAAASAVLLLGAGSIRWTPPRSAYLAAAAAGGAIGLALTSVVQAGAVLGESGAPAARLEYWLLPLAALIAGAFLLAAQTDAASRRLRRLAGVALVLLALSLGTLAEISAFGRVGEGGGSLDAVVAGLRASSVVIILSALHVRVVWRPRAPLTAAVGTAAIALAGLAMASAVVTGATDPFELVTVPVGLALVLGRLLPAAGENTGQDAGQNPAENPGTGAAPSVVSRRPVSVGVALGLGLAVLPSAFAGGTSTGAELLRPVLVLALSGALAVSGALLTRRPRWSAAAWPALVVGLLGVLITAGARILDLLAQVPLGPDARLEAWLLPAALLVVAAGTSLVAGIRRAAAVSGGHQATDPAGLRLGYGLVVLAIVGILAAGARPRLRAVGARAGDPGRLDLLRPAPGGLPVRRQQARPDGFLGGHRRRRGGSGRRVRAVGAGHGRDPEPAAGHRPAGQRMAAPRRRAPRAQLAVAGPRAARAPGVVTAARHHRESALAGRGTRGAGPRRDRGRRAAQTAGAVPDRCGRAADPRGRAALALDLGGLRRGAVVAVAGSGRRRPDRARGPLRAAHRKPQVDRAQHLSTAVAAGQDCAAWLIVSCTDTVLMSVFER
ncbi:hypothetical protein E3T32_14955 [Cryobacterium sp. TMT2-23]|nr:hypothetical protein [Cryobacterium sp. TMT2-23]TFD16713.1 hypothetical protein E3T32_14955 [Cryobacterium sp. TMT2-23]